MSFSKLATALAVIFFVSVIALIGELLYVLWRHRSFRRHSSPPPPIPTGDQNPDFPTANAATKELLYFFCLKQNIPDDPSDAPKNADVTSSPNDQVVDVFKLLEAHGPSRFLCTIKEEDKEDADSASEAQFVKRSTIRNTCLQSEEVDVTVDGVDGSTKTEFSTPCDSPLFFTPAGSPSRDLMELDFVVSFHGVGKRVDR